MLRHVSERATIILKALSCRSYLHIYDTGWRMTVRDIVRLLLSFSHRIHPRIHIFESLKSLSDLSAGAHRGGGDGKAAERHPGGE